MATAPVLVVKSFVQSDGRIFGWFELGNKKSAISNSFHA
jgi:hypothetical protein